MSNSSDLFNYEGMYDELNESRFRKRCLATVDDIVTRMLWDNRKDDEDMPIGFIEQQIKDGEVSVDEMVTVFRVKLQEAVDRHD